jgi:hypothetical protein
MPDTCCMNQPKILINLPFVVPIITLTSGRTPYKWLTLLCERGSEKLARLRLTGYSARRGSVAHRVATAVLTLQPAYCLQPDTSRG